MSKAKIIKGLLSLFQKKANPKAVTKLDIGPPRDPGVDYETAAALKKSRKIFDAQQKNLNPLQDELDRMLALEKSSLDELKISMSEMEEMTKVLDEFNRIADEDGIQAALRAFDGLLNPKRTLNADGGRVGMLSGGLAKGIMQAVNAARKGFKPFGEKQTYKQNLQNLGLANENALVNNFTNRLEKIMKTRQSQIPEEDLYDLFENIATGKQYDMVSTPIKKDMLAAVMQAMRKRNVDGSDFQNFIADIAPKTKRDILPNDVQSLLKQIDESDAFMEQLRGKTSSKIIPFKPKTKKADGGMVLNEILRSNVSSEEGYEKFLQELGQREREAELARLQKDMEARNQEPSDADKLAMLLAERDMQPKPPEFESKMFPPKKKKRVGVEGEIKEDFARINYGKPVGEDMFISGGIDYPYEADPILKIMLEKQLEDDLLLSARASKMQDQDPFFGIKLEKRFNKGGLVPPQKGPVSDGMGSLFRRK